MKVRIDDLVKIQNELDSRIFDLHNTSRDNTRNDRILALLVEAGELANETRIFKYWSLQKPSADEVVFEEFSDVLHFALSLGIDIAFDQEVIEIHPSDKTLDQNFHSLFHHINSFSISNSKEDYKALIECVFDLAHSLGMDGEMVRNMYLIKNEKNHQRQDNQY